MKPVDAEPAPPWQPLTPQGVASFSGASWRRLFVVLLIFAAFAGLSNAVFFGSAWFPTIREAMRALPDQGYIRSGRLAWTGDPAVVLAKSSWLALTVDVHHQQTHRLPCDIQVEFSGDKVRCLSLAGYLDIRYPSRWIIVFNEPELTAWWDAWEPFLAVGVGLTTLAGLFVVWPLLAVVYSIPVGAVCRFVDHQQRFAGVFRMCLAAQMPGCLLMSFSVLLYSVRAVDLIQVLFVMAAHFVVSWVYLALGVFFLPGTATTPHRRSNPFR